MADAEEESDRLGESSAAASRNAALQNCDLTVWKPNAHIRRSGRDCTGDTVQRGAMNATVKQFFVHAAWDHEAKVWFVADTDVPGLATEAASIDALAAKLKVMIPEMLELNGVIDRTHERIPFDLLAKFDGADGYC